MLREQVRPVSDADAAIRQAIVDGDMIGLGRIRPMLPGLAFGFLEQLLQDDGDADSPAFCRLAELLGDAGLLGAALAVYTRMADMKGDRDRRIQGYEGKVKIEGLLKMEWAAAADQRVVNRLRGIKNRDGYLLELDDGELYVQAAHNDPAAYDRLVALLPDSPLLQDPLRDPTLTKFFSQVDLEEGNGNGNAVDDCSFFVLDGDGVPVVQVAADARGCRYLGCHETAITVTRVATAHPLMAEAETLAIRQLMVMLEWCGCLHMVLELAEGEQPPPILNAWITRTKARATPYLSAWVDLSLSPEEIERGYRKGHRQSVRWGRENLRIVKTTTPDPVLFDQYVGVYAATGFIPALPVDRLAKHMEEGRFNLYVAYLDDRPVVTLLSSRHGKSSYYWASAKVIVGNRPLSHAVLHQAILDAKAEGQALFKFGRLEMEPEFFEDKMVSISSYKHGFASHTKPYLQFALRV